MFNNLLSVIVISHTGSFDKTKFCLKALLEQKTKINFEVLVINDGYDEKISKLVQSYKKYLDIKFFEREKDFCVSRSRNIGAKESKAKYLIFIDCDISLNPNAITNYYNLFSNNENISIWGECSSQKETDKRYPLFNKDFENYINTEKNIIIYFKPYSYAFSGNFGISKNLFIKSGGFNEEFIGHACEDIEFAYRLYKIGSKFIFSKDVFGNHLINLKNSNFHNSEYTQKNVKRIFKVMMKDIREFYSFDENIVLKEFEYISNFIKERIYIYYVMYFLSKDNKEEAIKYTKQALKYINLDEIKNLWEQYYIKKKNNELMIWF